MGILRLITEETDYCQRDMEVYEHQELSECGNEESNSPINE